MENSEGYDGGPFSEHVPVQSEFPAHDFLRECPTEENNDQLLAEFDLLSSRYNALKDANTTTLAALNKILSRKDGSICRADLTTLEAYIKFTTQTDNAEMK